jgi:hypothetical protein
MATVLHIIFGVVRTIAQPPVTGTKYG